MPPKAAQFQVDLPGLLVVLKNSVYSEPKVAIRELIQNAHDAISRRKQIDLDYTGRIEILFDSDAGTLQVIDDGIGLTLDDAKDHLCKLGSGISGKLANFLPKEKPNFPKGDRKGVVGRYGLGILSTFLIAEKIQIFSRPLGQKRSIGWQADKEGNVHLWDSEKETERTEVTLQLTESATESLQEEGNLEEIVRQYADFLPCPIHINGSDFRTNVIRTSWFDGSESSENIALELESYFEETPLEVIPVHIPYPPIKGALYVSPQRTPGFTERPSVTLTTSRMTIGKRIEGLLPDWAPFLRGILEIPNLHPNLARQDVMRDELFQKSQIAIEHFLLEYFHRLSEEKPESFQAIIHWHRYWIAGAAIDSPQLRSLLHPTYRFQTTRGPMTFVQLLEENQSSIPMGSEAEKVLWFNRDRKRQRWMEEMFQDISVPCIHTFGSFEEELLSTMVGDVDEMDLQLQTAAPSNDRFATSILGASELRQVSPTWQDFLGGTENRILAGSCKHSNPVFSFLDDRTESIDSFKELEQQKSIPEGFRRVLKNHFRQMPEGQNEVILNLNHSFIKETLSSDINNPKAGILRLLISSSLQSSGHPQKEFYRQAFQKDLDWIDQAFGNGGSTSEDNS